MCVCFGPGLSQAGVFYCLIWKHYKLTCFCKIIDKKLDMGCFFVLSLHYKTNAKPKAMKNEKHIRGIVVRETEKAINAKIRYEHPANNKMYEYTTWLPKSQIEVTQEAIFGYTVIRCAGWLADKIGNEIRRVVPGMCHNMGGEGLVY